jgi:peptide/nickel transport system permease protein
MRRVGRRLAEGGLVLLAVSALSFLMAEMAPGDFFSEMRLDPRVSEATLQALRHRHGLDRPIVVRYGRWLQSVARGEIGYSFAYGSPVGPLLWPRLRNTLVLAGSAVAAAWIVAIPLGVWWATRRRAVERRALSSLTSVLLATPDVVIALALLLLAVRTGWFPAGGMTSIGHEQMPRLDRIRDVASHLVLPAAALVLGILPLLLRHVRASVGEVLEAPFVRAARGHGIPERRLLFRHVLPAAANPLVSLFGLSLAGLLSMSLVVEVVMSWPGLGPLLLEAILARDFFLVLGLVLASTVVLVLGNVLADALLLAVDPRIRAEEG